MCPHIAIRAFCKLDYIERKVDMTNRYIIRLYNKSNKPSVLSIGQHQIAEYKCFDHYALYDNYVTNAFMVLERKQKLNL